MVNLPPVPAAGGQRQQRECPVEPDLFKTFSTYLYLSSLYKL